MLFLFTLPSLCNSRNFQLKIQNTLFKGLIINCCFLQLIYFSVCSTVKFNILFVYQIFIACPDKAGGEAFAEDAWEDAVEIALDSIIKVYFLHSFNYPRVVLTLIFIVIFKEYSSSYYINWLGYNTRKKVSPKWWHKWNYAKRLCSLSLRRILWHFMFISVHSHLPKRAVKWKKYTREGNICN